MRTTTRAGAAVALTAAALALVMTGCQGSVTTASSGPPPAPSAPPASASSAPAPSAAASSEPVPSAEPVPTVPVPTVPAVPTTGPTLPAVPTAPPAVLIVRLDSGFSPAAMHLGVGQRFLLLVSATVNAAVAGTPASCPLGATSAVGADLSVQCGPTGTYLFTAEHAGTAVVTAVVKPSCTPGTACTDWVTDARLTVTITT